MPKKDKKYIRKYIKGSQIHLFPSVCRDLAKGRGVFIGDKYYSAAFLLNWRFDTLLQHFRQQPFYSYYTR